MIFEEIINRGHEQVSYFNDPTLGLRGIVAIHNTVLGPALGGCRMWNYKSEKDALVDVLRLSKGMTYKAAIAGLNLGGGKAVIIGDPKLNKSEALFRSFGRFVEGLGGRYITAEDVGTSIKDMDYVRMETKYVTGISKSLGGSGDPSLLTAFGTYLGIKASVKFKFDEEKMNGKLEKKAIIIHDTTVRKKACLKLILFFWPLNEKNNTNPMKKVKTLENI